VIPACSIAVLDDEVQMRRALRRLLGSHGYEVEEFAGGGEFLASEPAGRFDCLLLDLHMPGLDGFEVLRALSRLPAPPPVIVITGQDQPGTAARTAALGASGYLLKPIREASLLEAIHRCAKGTAPH